MIDIAESAAVARYRFRWLELLPLLVAIAIFFCAPDYLVFATSVLVMAIFAVSLDLAIGFAGILTLGHGLFYGFGAYTAGLIALAGWHEPISGVLFGAAVAAAAAAVTGPFILRFKGLSLVMITLALASIALEAANKMSWLTGGHDGLQSIEIAPILGLFPWSMDGAVGYLYAFGWLLVAMLAVRTIVSSPFGVALQGIRENESRMRMIGAPVLSQLTLAYVMSASLAGVAGALSAQTNAFVSLNVLSLDLSLYALAMLVLGGIGRIYGAVLGAALYMTVQYFTAQWDPYYWMFSIGLMLILVVRFWRGGLLGGLAQARDRLARL